MVDHELPTYAFASRSKQTTIASNAPIVERPCHRRVDSLEQDKPAGHVDGSIDSPPLYTAVDAHATRFSFTYPFIYSISSSSQTPHYQVDVQRLKSGKPYKLRIRPLPGYESRALSLALAEPGREDSKAGKGMRPNGVVPFDKEGTMYEITNLSALGGWNGLSGMEIKGFRASTLKGYVRVEKTNVLGKKSYSFWHHTRNEERDALKDENRARLERRGYHAQDEWNSSLLLQVKCDVWTGGVGQVKAKVEQDTLSLNSCVDKKTKDLLVTCWLVTCWTTKIA